MEQITTRPQLYRTDYKNIGLTFAAAFLGSLLALGILMLFGKMLVKKQLKELEKMDIPQPPQPQYTPPKRVVEEQTEAVEVETIEANNLTEKPADTTKERPRLNGRFIKRQTDSN